MDWDKKIEESFDKIIDTFYNRIKKIIDQNNENVTPSIQRELNRIKPINGGKIPEKIKELIKDIDFSTK